MNKAPEDIPNPLQLTRHSQRSRKTLRVDNHLKGRRIGFISTRLSGTDGVSLETEKWATVLEGIGHSCFYCAGESDRPAALTRIIPEAHFTHPEVKHIHEISFSCRNRPLDISMRIQTLKDLLKDQIYAFVVDFQLELIIVENALSIPLNLPLGLALTEFIAETGFPTIAHHHDFFWERQRFLVNSVWDYLNMAFPPHLPSIRHVVINSSGANQLSLRTGISPMIVPNVMDFEHPPEAPDEYTKEIRADLGIQPDEYFFLQPTRVVQRKGIELAIELTRRAGLKSRLVISHASGDEGNQYESRVHEYADLLGVPVNFVSKLISDKRGLTAEGNKIYTLWDVYPYSDLVTYPSTIEGFGNAFLEAIYYRKPIVVNNYTIYDIDIKPKGFKAIEFDGFITDETVEQVIKVMRDDLYRKEMVEFNYQIARRYYSFSILRRRLQTLISDTFGEDVTT